MGVPGRGLFNKFVVQHEREKEIARQEAVERLAAKIAQFKNKPLTKEAFEAFFAAQVRQRLLETHNLAISLPKNAGHQGPPVMSLSNLPFMHDIGRFRPLYPTALRRHEREEQESLVGPEADEGEDKVEATGRSSPAEEQDRDVGTKQQQQHQRRPVSAVPASRLVASAPVAPPHQSRTRPRSAAPTRTLSGASGEDSITKASQPARFPVPPPRPQSAHPLPSRPLSAASGSWRAGRGDGRSPAVSVPRPTSAVSIHSTHSSRPGSAPASRPGSAHERPLSAASSRSMILHQVSTNRRFTTNTGSSSLGYRLDASALAPSLAPSGCHHHAVVRCAVYPPPRRRVIPTRALAGSASHWSTVGSTVGQLSGGGARPLSASSVAASSSIYDSLPPRVKAATMVDSLFARAGLPMPMGVSAVVLNDGDERSIEVDTRRRTRPCSPCGCFAPSHPLFASRPPSRTVSAWA
mmetsp:Transcript_33460/g.78431  ORF Transcript_33460/g.78431 Transcript_33460/m.78431 type:complete len:465 (+) Transcript_33460:269-1663(+)